MTRLDELSVEAHAARVRYEDSRKLAVRAREIMDKDLTAYLLALDEVKKHALRSC